MSPFPRGTAAKRQGVAHTLSYQRLFVQSHFHLPPHLLYPPVKAKLLRLSEFEVRTETGVGI